MHEHSTSTAILAPLKQYWGYDSLRPLQREAIEAGMTSVDSLLVMPTGGGKSLCYQIPPVIAQRTDVVVSPLISLMKDQVDGLVQCGYPAAALNSSLQRSEQSEIIAHLRAGVYRLLFVSPERLVAPGFLSLLQEIDVRAFSIDEAHCISHWGHDFRPEYRQLRQIKDWFPKASVHAFTATATPQVQQDIVEQLGLDNATRLIGRFDRPNLTYRIRQRVDLRSQVLEALQRHPNEASIIYCITRKETERLAEWLEKKGLRAAAYHGGMESDDRRRTQESFSSEQLDVVVATVAFGMGIDRSNVRCIIHAGMPKSIEHYQQQTGRAGRDGLEAECVLLYSPADVIRWQQIMNKANDPSEASGAHAKLLQQMQAICNTIRCRHRALTEYFGQHYDKDNCSACDVCLDEVESMADATVLAQKILSCVARVGNRFGVGHVVAVLRGRSTAQIERLGHDQLSTYGLLSEHSDKVLTNFVYQLVDQGLLTRTGDERPILQNNQASLTVLRGQHDVQLLEPKAGRVRRAKADKDGWDGVDIDLFERLRQLRTDLASERSVPPYLIFSDRSLRAMAQARPSSADAMRGLYGVGEKKLAQFGPQFLRVIESYRASDSPAVVS